MRFLGRREPVQMEMQHPVAEPPPVELAADEHTVISRAYVIAMLDDLMAAAQRAGCAELVDMVIDERTQIRRSALYDQVPVIPGRSS